MPVAHPTECTPPRPAVVLVFGAPLPGRAGVARALERQLPYARRLRAPFSRLPIERVRAALAVGEVPIVEGDFALADERRAAIRDIAELDAEAVFVAWICDPEEARRETYRRYARVPKRYADQWWTAWQRDEARRQPLGKELASTPLVALGARGSVLDHVVRVAAALGVSTAQPGRLVPRRRVLLVDDDPASLELLGDTLTALGYDTLAAGTAEEALALAAEETLDVVISDQQMPGASGTELAADLALLSPDVRVVILTGYAEETVGAAIDSAGVDLLLAKPVSGSDLLRLLDELTEDDPETA